MHGSFFFYKQFIKKSNLISYYLFELYNLNVLRIISIILFITNSKQKYQLSNELRYMLV